jgi:hypothetical protein
MKKKETTNLPTNGCLLTYLPATYPSPLQVSMPQTTMTGVLNTLATNEETTPAYCKEVMIAVPVGTDKGELFASQPAPSASCNTSKWAISSMEFKSGEELDLDPNLQYATFTFDCRSQTDYLINYNLVFGVQGQMTQTPSECTIKIMETSGTTSDPTTFTQKQTTYTVKASTPEFYLQNFVAIVSTAPTVPVTEFGNSAPIKFQWESNGTFFQLYQKNVAQPVYSGTQTNYLLTGGVATSTTFFLVAMMSGDPTGDQPSGNYQPIYLYDALTITISNPDLAPKSAVISGNATVGGTLGVTNQTTLGNATVGGTLGVTGQTTLGNATVGGTLGVTNQTTLGNATVGGTLGVTGQTTLGSANVSTLGVSGQANLNNTSVAGTLGVTGLATLTGGLLGTANSVSLVTGPQAIAVGRYTPNTDGFVIGSVSSPSNPNLLCVGWIFGRTDDGVSVYATGGNTGCFDSNWQKNRVSNNQSFIMPVRKGIPFNLAVGTVGSNEAAPIINYWWIPLGTAPNAQTLEKISDEQLAFEIGHVHRKPLDSANKVKTLIGVIEKILEKKISHEDRNELVSALLDLQVEDYVNE